MRDHACVFESVSVSSLTWLSGLLPVVAFPDIGAPRALPYLQERPRVNTPHNMPQFKQLYALLDVLPLVKCRLFAPGVPLGSSVLFSVCFVHFNALVDIIVEATTRSCVLHVLPEHGPTFVH